MQSFDVHAYKDGSWNHMIFAHLSGQISMRNRDPHRENVENILAICLPIVTMQHIRESPPASHAMRKSAWNVPVLRPVLTVLWVKRQFIFPIINPIAVENKVG